MGVGVTLLSLTSKFFYVMSKVLSAELSCMLTGLVVVESCMRTASESNTIHF